jgi:hypothetical protein
MYQLRYLEQAKADLIQIKRYISRESVTKFRWFLHFLHVYMSTLHQWEDEVE